MFSSVIEWKKFWKFDASANDAEGTENWKFTERIVDVPVVQKEQIAVTRHRLLRSESAAEEVLNIHTAEIIKVLQLQVIDEVAKVPRSTQGQVAMIQEMQQDLKPEEVQISFNMYVDHGSVCKKACTTLSPYLKGRKLQKDQTSVHKCKANCKAPREKREQTKRLTMNSREWQPIKWCQTCGKHE